MAGEHSVFDLRNHALVVTDDSRHHPLPGAQAREQVVAHLGSHRPNLVAFAPELSKRGYFQQTLIHFLIFQSGRR